MGGIFSRPKEPELPKPDPPIAPATTVDEPAVRARPKYVGGSRGRTIIAGDLTPNKLFKRKVLG